MSDIAVIVSPDLGFDRAAAGLLGAARGLGGTVHVIVDHEKIAAGVARFADRVIIGSPLEVCRQLQPRIILLGNDTDSQALAPRLAYRLGGSAVGDGTEVRLEGDVLRVVRQVYGGKANAVVELKRKPGVVWLRARSFAPAPMRDTPGEITRAAIDVPPDLRVRIVERKREEQGQARLEDARVIVSGGRGIGGPEGFTNELRPLAELLGAQLAASRAACDAGWVPPTWQVGQTGKKVAPELYLAIAITGASQHMAGVSDAKTIAAINIDPDAPIFRHARFGIVEDYRKVVPLLREKLKQLQK